MYVDMKTWLVDDILVKTDRASMANSLEVRAPFLDHRIVEFAASLPVNYKIKGKRGKHILKKSQIPFLPKTTLKRRKEGFNSPIAIWLNNDLHDMAYAMTTNNNLLNWFEKSAIDKLWKQHEKHQQDNSYRLFGLLNLSLWLEAYNI
jgi:asparagine synthase (glutamine-hydrolysing)